MIVVFSGNQMFCVPHDIASCDPDFHQLMI